MFNFDSYVLAWSKTQNTFFIEHVSVHIENNLRHFSQNSDCDAIVVGIFSTHNEAVEMSEKLRDFDTNS
ncbi:hypothetical protein [Lonepinella sp. MS14436]|uniref:hypothetical protein n=1 Tax=Lonepinella sp. MS14436 TaxID=3003619 RepID=UPI0036DBF96C